MMQTRLLTIGNVAFTVYGGDREGWSPDPQDFEHPVPLGARYESLDEIYFALANLSVAGRAEV